MPLLWQKSLSNTSEDELSHPCPTQVSSAIVTYYSLKCMQALLLVLLLPTFKPTSEFWTSVEECRSPVFICTQAPALGVWVIVHSPAEDLPNWQELQILLPLTDHFYVWARASNSPLFGLQHEKSRENRKMPQCSMLFWTQFREMNSLPLYWNLSILIL